MKNNGRLRGTPIEGFPPTESPLGFLKDLYSNCWHGYVNFRDNPGSMIGTQYVPVKHVWLPEMPAKKDIFFRVATTDLSSLEFVSCTSDKILEVPAVWLDCGADFFRDRKRRRNFIYNFPQPTIWVRKGEGNGRNFYWLLTRPAQNEEIGLVEDVNRRLAKHWGGDMNCTSADSFLRMPGFMNSECDPPKLVFVKSTNLYRQYSLQTFIDILP